MESIFRIHGDNIVECERVAKIIIDVIKPYNQKTYLISPSTIAIQFTFKVQEHVFSWQLQLLPGFNKSGRRRWEGNIFDSLRANGSFLEETPDAIITKIENDQETILCAIEFCSALQAGNQAWQRSGRAFSTGRTGCPYLYIVDFVKYELDSHTRERKALRFPNPAVPYSYISFSQQTGCFIAQVYVKSEEFDKARDKSLINFDEHNFADHELALYIFKTMLGIDTTQEKEVILQKNLNVVRFLAQSSRPNTNFTAAQWQELYNSHENIISYSLHKSSFNFHKTITEKGHHGKSTEMLDLIDIYSVGLASRDLPFGIIPASNRAHFAEKLLALYSSFDHNVIKKIGSGSKNLIICLIKGFKPHGDDNRPDRGILPFAVMLAGTNVEIMTYLYGPLVEDNYYKLINNPKQLAASNGLWKSILSLSDYVALDVPILSSVEYDREVLLDTCTLKQYYTKIESVSNGLRSFAFSPIPRELHEDDVDTGIHYMFAHLLKQNCFEGMCNPPGGDWSGMSLLEENGFEVRWLSLPRVSNAVNGKRPDHVLEIYNVFQKPVLLAIESKERAVDLEPDVGKELINYISHLMKYTPSVERKNNPSIGNWRFSDETVDASKFVLISAAAYLRSASLPSYNVFNNSQCDMLFVMDPLERGWDVEILCRTENAKKLKYFLYLKIMNFENNTIKIH